MFPVHSFASFPVLIISLRAIVHSAQTILLLRRGERLAGCTLDVAARRSVADADQRARWISAEAARRGGEEESSVPRPARGRRRVEDGLYYFFSPRRSLRARGSSRASCVRRRARASSGMLRADAVESSARGAGRGPRGRVVLAMDARGEARVVRAAAGERERRRARMGWTSRAMRREGVVVGRGGSGVEVNNGGGVGAN